MTSYHPDANMLLEFSAGNLPLGQSMCVSVHLDYCHRCKQQVMQMQELGALMFKHEAVEPQQESDPLKDRLFAKLDDIDEVDQPVETVSEAMAEVPRALRQFVDRPMRELNWSRVTSKFFFASLNLDKRGSELALTKVSPGGSMAHHQHTGREFTLVLEGSFSDEDGLYLPGDFIVREQGENHKPVATKNAECICLTWVERPVEFTGILTRLLNPLLKRRVMA